MRILYLFSGSQRKTSVAAVLKSLLRDEVQIDEVDILLSPDHDMTCKAHRDRVLQDLKKGLYDAVLLTPPCSTWSRVRGANFRGPPMIRSREHVWGFPWLSAAHERDASLGNILVVFMLDVLELLQRFSSKGLLVIVWAEHPEDLGTIWREEDQAELYPASIWQLTRLRSLLEGANALMLFSVAFCQCCFGAPYRKPTRILTNLHPLRQWGPEEWPSFHADGTYAGPLANSCSCKTTVSLARRKSDEAFRTTGTGAYPEKMDASLARALHDCWSSHSSKVGNVECSASPASSAAVEDQARVVTQNPSRQERTEEGPRQQNNSSGGNSGLGPPMEVYYKGIKRPVHDGGGLCSPGRWPVSRRKELNTEASKALQAKVQELFRDWMRRIGMDKAKERFWKLAAGKLKGEVFFDIENLRADLDRWLSSKGGRPERRETDIPTEINFRRLSTMLEMVEDEDWKFLTGVVETGVELGVDQVMPRVPEVYEEKTKWTVDGTEEELRDTEAANYTSAEENAADITRQVKEEVQRGTIVAMSLERAKKEFEGRLAIAALGALPKELGTNKVRLIHDGSYSVDVNRRIRVRDQMRFPLIDDASAVMMEAEEECRGGASVRFAIIYDIARAHKLIPVVRRDWGLQAFRLPGDDSGQVYVHTRGTFGIASAAYWWGRCAACVVRLAHRLGGRLLGILHLLYADDGWAVATGQNFWAKLLYWMFVLDLLEVPISWHKVGGGASVAWIGYQLDLHRYELGISEKKQRWILDWVDDKLLKGGIVGRDLRSALGRLSFVAGALRHVRPFLAPLFAWCSSLAPGTFAAFPPAVVTLLQFISDEVKRRPMRRARRAEPSRMDCFRVDASASGDTIRIGGWESWGGVSHRKARWFAVELTRKTAPWAYLRGDPFRSIASLELMGVLLALMVFGPEAKWSRQGGLVTLSAYTDNAGNSHVLRKFASSKYPLSILVMEMATQLDAFDAEMELAWVPRNQNVEADDLTNARYEEFDAKLRVEVDLDKLPFMVLPKLMEQAGKLDSELKLHRTSKEAKLDKLREERSLPKAKRSKKGEMRWRDPW